MTADKRQDKLVSSLMELMTEHGTEGMKEAMRLLLNEAMVIERQETLGVTKPYESHGKGMQMDLSRRF